MAHAYQGDALAVPDLAFSGLGMEDDLFQGAPPLPRVDTGDAFDTFLQRWMSGTVNNRSSHPKLQPVISSQAPELTFADTLPQASASQYQQEYGQTELLGQVPAASVPRRAGGHELEHQLGPQAGYWGQLPRTQQRAATNGAQFFSQGPDAIPSDIMLMSQPLKQQPADVSSAAPSSISMLSTEEELLTSNSAKMGGKASPGVSSISQNKDAAQAGSKRNSGSCAAPIPTSGLSTEDAKSAWTAKRRRGPTSEESKEKERARNRRAQKRFREREKERQEQRQNALATLEAELASLAKAKEALQERNAVLERAVALRQGEARMAADPKDFDPQTYVEAKIDDPTELTITVGKQSRDLTKREISELTRRDHLSTYKQYVDELRGLLSADAGPQREDRIVALVRELCALNLAVALAKPKEFADFQASRLDEEEPPSQPSPPPSAVWKRCLGAMQLGADQKRVLLEERRKFLARLGTLLRQRWELHGLMQDMFAYKEAATEQRASHYKAMEAVESLRENLREEQVMLVQTMCATHQSILAPHQTAANIVTAYPYYPDVLMLVDVMASETPGEEPATQLLGTELPPI